MDHDRSAGGTDQPELLQSEGPGLRSVVGAPGGGLRGFGDGSVQALTKQTDAANLFFLITKNNNDPFYLP